MEHPSLGPGRGDQNLPHRPIQQVWDRVLPPGVKARMSEYVRMSVGVKNTQSFMQDLMDAFSLRDTIRDFILNIVIRPVRGGDPDPAFEELLKDAAVRGLPLIMVPSRPLLVDVVTTTSFAEGAHVMFGGRDEIVERCWVMLKGSIPRDFAPTAGEILEQAQPIALEAAELFTTGRYIGAQATATAFLDTLLAKVVGGPHGFPGLAKTPRSL